MHIADIAALRLAHHRLSASDFTRPEEVVGWLGAVQSQDYGGAKWALALRLSLPTTDAAIDEAFNAGRILRTHILRPTWHFVLPDDIRWMLLLTAPRVQQLNGTYYRKTGLDGETLVRAARIIEGELRDGAEKTRPELLEALRREGIESGNTIRSSLLVMYAELEGLIVSGARRGKQFTYALMETRVSPAKPLRREEALAALLERYFRSHGPATIKDFCGWSGLTQAEAAGGMEALRGVLAYETIEGREYWFDESARRAPNPPLALLLPNYDEYTVAYRDNSGILDEAYAPAFRPPYEDIYSHIITIAGKVAGTWKRTLSKQESVIPYRLFRPLESEEQSALEAAAARYGAFIGRSARLIESPD